MCLKSSRLKKALLKANASFRYLTQTRKRHERLFKSMSELKHGFDDTKFSELSTKTS